MDPDQSEAQLSLSGRMCTAGELSRNVSFLTCFQGTLLTLSLVKSSKSTSITSMSSLIGKLHGVSRTHFLSSVESTVEENRLASAKRACQQRQCMSSRNRRRFFGRHGVLMTLASVSPGNRSRIQMESLLVRHYRALLDSIIIWRWKKLFKNTF